MKRRTCSRCAGWRRREHYWQNWARGLAIPFEWQDEVIRAAITLKLCTVEDAGAVLAALTTSVPESAHSGRNWDYRFCWLRDAFFTVQALNRLGATRTMENYLHYIDRVVACTADGALQPVYRIAGDAASRSVRYRRSRDSSAWDPCAPATRLPNRSSTMSTAR